MQIFQNERERITQRGCCFLRCKDHLVSKEMCEVMRNVELEMLVTSPIPTDIEDY